jgi:hypothetical protein
VSLPEIKAAHQCTSDDRFEAVPDRHAAETLLRSYLGDAQAMHKLRAALSVTDQNVFRLDDHVVLEAAVGKVVKGELRVKKDPCERKDAKNRLYLDWIKDYRRDAIEIASMLRTSLQNILGFSAMESDFGRNRFARDANNFFSLTTTKKDALPGQIGFMVAMGDPNVVVAKFEDYLGSGKAFAKTKGQLILSETDPVRFAFILQNRGNFGMAPDGPLPGYAKEMGQVIHDLQIRLNC